WPLMIPLFIAIAPLGMALGNASAIAMSAVSARTTGLASSFLGLGQFALAGVAAALVGLGGETTPVPVAIIMLASGVIAIAGLVLLRLTRTPEPEPVPAARGGPGRSLGGVWPISRQARRDGLSDADPGTNAEAVQHE